jgi:hypothetical protein
MDLHASYSENDCFPLHINIDLFTTSTARTHPGIIGEVDVQSLLDKYSVAVRIEQIVHIFAAASSTQEHAQLVIMR